MARHENNKNKRFKKFGGLSGKWALIHRSETIKNNQNPVWAPFTIDINALVGGDMDRVFKLEVWDSDNHSNHDFIGGNVTTLRELMASREVRLINKHRVGIYNSAGRVEVLKCAPF